MMMRTSKKERTVLHSIYITILVVLTLMALFAIYFVKMHGALSIFEPGRNDLIKIIVIMSLLIGIPVSHLFYNKKIKHIPSGWSLDKKVMHFRTAFIARITVLEAVAVLAIIAYLLNADTSFMYMFGIIFVLFIIHAPTKHRISTDLELNEEEQDKL